MKKLNIGSFSLPQDFVTQTAAILARKRVGKTYTASVIAEEMIEAKLPFVVLDPTGVWWGLRSSADGKREGYPVVVIEDTLFVRELQSLLNKHSRENDSNTPDFILADYLRACLDTFNIAVVRREKWYGRPAGPPTP